MIRPFKFQPVIIIGAGRSGTNMLRDLLSALPGCATWPCDEINYIWRYGNARFPTDELGVEQARREVIRYIRRRFEKISERSGATYVIEKTCANSLRADFVQAVVPEAKYIFLVRTGWDVALSAEKRWRSPLDLQYILKKAVYVPAFDMPQYALRYAGNRLRRLFNKERRLSTWGPKCARLSEWCANLPTLEVCVRQWHACVQRASMSLSLLPRRQVQYVRYEDFVVDPVQQLRRLCSFTGIHATDSKLVAVSSAVRTDSVGRAKVLHLGGRQGELMHLVSQTLREVDSIWGNPASDLVEAA